MEGRFGGGYAIVVGCGGGGGYGNGGRHGFQLHFSIAKNRLERPTFIKNSGGLRPWTSLGAAPPDPCRSLLAALWAAPITARFAR